MGDSDKVGNEGTYDFKICGWLGQTSELFSELDLAELLPLPLRCRARCKQ
jgi:hypothetical protein